jgi:hypothetical protein
MSSLESKTTRQVIDTALGTEDWDLKGLGITKVKTDFEKPMWVLSEDAQKEIGKKQNLIDSLKKMVEVQSQIKREAVDAAVNLEAKVEAVNKVLDKAEFQEIASLRAVLERLLRVMDEGLFVDYQMEKFGQIKYDKELLINKSNKTGDQ